MLVINTRSAPPRKVGGGLDSPEPRPRPPAPSRVRTPPRPVLAPEPEPLPPVAPEPDPVAEVIELDQRRPATDLRAAVEATIANLDDGMLPAVIDLLAAVLAAGTRPERRTRRPGPVWACPMPTGEEADWTANRPRALAPFHCRHCGRPFHVRRHLEAHEDAAVQDVAA